LHSLSRVWPKPEQGILILRCTRTFRAGIIDAASETDANAAGMETQLGIALLGKFNSGFRALCPSRTLLPLAAIHGDPVTDAEAE
jgi:hypothetical protein